jgi:hypothetical protein
MREHARRALREPLSEHSELSPRVAPVRSRRESRRQWTDSSKATSRLLLESAHALPELPGFSDAEGAVGASALETDGREGSERRRCR